MFLDLVEFLLFSLPLIYFWQQGRLKTTIELPAPEPLVHRWGSVALVMLFLTLYLVFGWWSVIAEHGWEGMLKFQGTLQ